VTLRLVPALSARAMRMQDAPPTMKLACGENPMRIYGQAKGAEPQTRMAEVAMLRQKLENARAYKLESGKARDFATDALAQVLRGEILVQNHCYRADEMLVRLDLFAEFGTAPRAFHHAVEAYKIRDQLARGRRRGGVGGLGGAEDGARRRRARERRAARSGGVRVALHSDSPYDIQRLNQEAARGDAARAARPASPWSARPRCAGSPRIRLDPRHRRAHRHARGRARTRIWWSGR
jgi:imidazolonepropionase-like amidohydrolase